MAIKVLALASGVTGLADHRVLNGALTTSAGTIQVRGGVLPGAGAGALSTVSAMVARVAPLKAVIANSVSAALGPYVLVSDANVDITFDAGEASVARVDRIIARTYDNTNDGSGSTTGAIEYLKGQASGSATALPNNSLLLYEMTVPAGASAGSGGLTFANAVDQRVYTAANGGIFPVASNTAMGAITSPYEGMTIYRTDLDVLYIYDGTTWRGRGIANVASSANLTSINNPYDGQVAVTRDTDAVYVYTGSAWTQPKSFFTPKGRVVASGTQTLADNTQVALTFGSGTEVIDTHGQHSEVTNPTRITPNVAGYYRFYGTAFMDSLASGVSYDVNFRLNGSSNLAPAARITGAAQVTGINCTVLQYMNGTTDYMELMARQDSAGSDVTTQSAQFSSVIEWEYVGPQSY